MTDRVTVTTLRMAQALIETRGWRKGPVRIGASAADTLAGTSLCIAEAIYVVAGLKGCGGAPMEAIRRATGSVNAVKWNDTIAQDQAEVIAMLDRAIALAEGEPA